MLVSGWLILENITPLDLSFLMGLVTVNVSELMTAQPVIQTERGTSDEESRVGISQFS